VEKLDRLTASIKFSEPYFLAAETALETEILPRHVYEPFVREDPEKFNKIRDNPIVGSGPYKLERWITGQECVIVRNENYWGRKPALDRIVFKFIKSPQAEFQALRKGEIDMMAPTPQQYDQSHKDEDFLREFRIVKYNSPLSGYSYIAYNQENALFKDPKVRLAFTHAIDRESIIKNVLYGVGKVAFGTFYQQGRQIAPDLTPWPYDLEKARALLAEAGWKDTDGDGILDKDGRKFAFEYMLTTDNPIGEQIARYFKDQMQKLGVRVSLSPYEWSVFLERLNEKKFEVTSLSWGGGGPESDPFQIWHSSQSKDRGSNFISWHNARADSLIEKARVELDPAKRNALFHEFSRILHQEQPYTFMVARENIGFIHKRFENVKIHKLRLDPLEWYVPRDRQLRGK
jgi:peptide/nickel transport system substrate-binding protein